MPNWCDNSVRLTHSDKSKVDALEAVLQSEERGVFSHLRPMPEGTDDWYMWNVNHWGTKWEMSVIDWERQDDNTIWISFESAWSPPIAMYDYLHEFGDWEVEGLYHEPGCAFCGIWKDGEDDFYEYNFRDLESLEALPGDLQDFTGLIDYHHSCKENGDFDEDEE